MIDLNTGDLVERLGQGFAFVFMGREGFGYDINRHTAIRFCRLSKPGHLGGLLCLTQRRRLKLLTNPTLRISGIVQLRCRRFTAALTTSR